MTIMIYLNEGFTGGCTQFLDPKNELNSNDVVPKTGQALLFDHLIYHAGAPLTEGVKYAIRTDVMFSTKPSPVPYNVAPVLQEGTAEGKTGKRGKTRVKMTFKTQTHLALVQAPVTIADIVKVASAKFKGFRAARFAICDSLTEEEVQEDQQLQRVSREGGLSLLLLKRKKGHSKKKKGGSEGNQTSGEESAGGARA
jgi:hypothetical protein